MTCVHLPYIGISPFHVLPFGVEQDYTLNVPGNHIPYIGISLPHVCPFGVEQDSSL